MILYLDSSAIVKLVHREAESAALRMYLRQHAGDARVSSVLARVEVVRAVLSGGASLVSAARRQVGRLALVGLHEAVLDDAATLGPSSRVRSLDAIHLASARQLGTELRSVVTYDTRLADVAQLMSLPVVSPS